jgi:aryl-alcohol dehydrogenase-like predicted oxidoreductase
MIFDDSIKPLKNMEKRKFGKTDMNFPCSASAARKSVTTRIKRQTDVDLLLNSALRRGMNVIDTAGGV